MKKIKSRREFLCDLSRLVGTAAATSLLTPHAMSVAMAYSPTTDSHAKAGKTFTLDELNCLRQVCAIVIPRTATPSAADVDVHGFIDNQLYHCYDQSQQQQASAVLALIEQQAIKRHHNPFIYLAEAEQFQLLTDLDAGQQAFSQPQRKDFKALKALICFGFYTSEAGASQELRYQAVPGGFKGSIPYKATDKSWGSLGLFY